MRFDAAAVRPVRSSVRAEPRVDRDHPRRLKPARPPPCVFLPVSRLARRALIRHRRALFLLSSRFRGRESAIFSCSAYPTNLGSRKPARHPLCHLPSLVCFVQSMVSLMRHPRQPCISDATKVWRLSRRRRGTRRATSDQKTRRTTGRGVRVIFSPSPSLPSSLPSSAPPIDFMTLECNVGRPVGRSVGRVVARSGDQ